MGESVTAKVTLAQGDLLPSLSTSRSVQRWPRLSRSDRHEGHPGAVLVLLGWAVQGRTPQHRSCSGSGSQLCLSGILSGTWRSQGNLQCPSGLCECHRARAAPLQTPQQPLHLTSAFSYPGAHRLCSSFFLFFLFSSVALFAPLPSHPRAQSPFVPLPTPASPHREMALTPWSPAFQSSVLWLQAAHNTTSQPADPCSLAGLSPVRPAEGLGT